MALWRLAATLLLVLLPLAAQATLPERLQHYVTDKADLLPPRTELQLEHFLEDFERSDSTQVAVVTVPTLAGRNLEQYSIELAQNSGLGQRGRDNGVLLLIARQERQVRIEVGKGLEGRLTDLLAGRIIDQEIVPQFRQGAYADGVLAGVTAICAAVRGEYQDSSRKAKKERDPLSLLLVLLFLAPALLPRGSRRSGGFWIGGGGFGGSSGGSSGGGGFSGGGGSFGGGGASGNW